MNMNIDEKELEALMITQEECSEVAQAISKCFRFGLNNYKPNGKQTNRCHLEEEIGDLVAMFEILVDKGIVSKEKINSAAKQKVEKLRQWSNVF